MVAKNANPKRWPIRPSIDGRRYSKYQNGNKTPSGLLTLPYVTTGNTVENPHSEGGIFLGGAQIGLDWHDQQSNGSGIFGTQPAPSEFDDNIERVNPEVFTFGLRQYVLGKFLRAGGYNPTQVHECELHLWCFIGPHHVSTMELLMDTAGNSTFNRWNGDLNDVSFLSPSGTGIGTIANNDEILFRVDENGLFEAFKNPPSLGSPGTALLSLTDTTLLGIEPAEARTPGDASFWRPHASIVPTNFGFSRLQFGTW